MLLEKTYQQIFIIFIYRYEDLTKKERRVARGTRVHPIRHPNHQTRCQRSSEAHLKISEVEAQLASYCIENGISMKMLVKSLAPRFKACKDELARKVMIHIREGHPLPPIAKSIKLSNPTILTAQLFTSPATATVSTQTEYQSKKMPECQIIAVD